MYTDGVTEAMNDDGRLFSEKRLADHLRTFTVPTTKSAVEDVFEAVKQFEGAEQADDITILAVQLRDQATP